MNNEHLGNKNTKIFFIFVIVVLFVFGFMKSMMGSQTKQTITTNHLSLELNSDWNLVNYKSDTDEIVIKDSSGEAIITYGIASEMEDDVETINDFKVYSTNLETSNGYLLNVTMMNENNEAILVSYESKNRITEKNTKIQKLLKNLSLNK